MTLLAIAQLGQPVLRQVAKPVVNLTDRNIVNLIDNLMTTLMDVNGVGMAAPQVYESKRIFIVASHPNPRYPHAPQMEPTPVINPKITSHDQKKEKDWEGCLSVPGVRALVPRYTRISVEFINRSGAFVRSDYAGFIARIFQHEFDHLDGLVFLDRVENNRDIISEKEYQRMLAKK